MSGHSCRGTSGRIKWPAQGQPRDELLWINNALADVIGGPEAIEDWEFQTRIGGTRDEVSALLQRVNDEVDALRRADPGW